MSSPLVASIRNTIQRHKMLRAGNRVAVAVSGGADSVALLRLLEELGRDLGTTLCIVHFNHQLRSGDSAADEQFVAKLARERGLEFMVGSDDVAAIAKKHRWNLEDAARRLRYDFFAKIVAKGGATCVATAHTADDQAETVLARLIRGTGLTGLASIYPVRNHIVRPLLDIRRADLRAYLTAIRQEWREDATNADTTRLRARVRQLLVPKIEQNFSTSIVRKLGELASLARDDERFWRALVDERCHCLVSRTEKAASIQTHELLRPLGSSMPRHVDDQSTILALTQRIVRRLHADFATSGGELSRGHVAQIIQLAEKDVGGRRVHLPGGVCIQKEFDRLIFTNDGKTIRTKNTETQKVSYAYNVEVPSCGTAAVSVPELSRTFHLKVIDWPMRERETRHEGVVLDAERLRPPLILRNWKPGDAYCPSGRRHSRKLARMLIAGRISVARRALWPVLTSAGRIVWAGRMPVAEEFSATEATRTGLCIIEDGG
jgi:tRNA(Ile)-lysidine synthase